MCARAREGPPSHSVLLLDPLDGTRLYLDGHPNSHRMVRLADAEDDAAVVVIGTSSEGYQRLLELITAHAEGSRSTWRADVHGARERGVAVLRLLTRSSV